MKYSFGVQVLFLAAMSGGVVAAQSGAASTGDSAAAPNYASGNAAEVQSVEAAGSAAQPATEDQAVAKAAMQPGDSHVRIVRLSDVAGTVGMDRLTGQGVETAIRNMPVIEGAKLATGPNGLAEVEFEDQSTMGLAPDSMVEFTQLVRHGGGGTASTMKLVRGTMYVNLAGTKGNSFAVQVGEDHVSPAPGTRLRIEMNAAEGKDAGKNAAKGNSVAVFSGSAVVQGAAGSETTVAKKESLMLGGDAGAVQVAKNVEKGPYDSWNKDEDEYQQRYSKANSLVGSQGYGVSDLNYYGNFVNLPGCGMMWQPYFVDASWSPYATGLWAAYPGAGYSWVSPYPWGWLPYHSGAWSQCGAAGWGWRPGGSFYGLQNVAGGGGTLPTGTVVGTNLNNRPVQGALPVPPRAGQGSLVMASHGPIVTSRMENDGFVFQKNSAGLGVPRGQLGNLNGVSREVVHNGAMSMPVDVRSMSRGPNGNGEAHNWVRMRPAGEAEVHNGAGNGVNNGANNGTNNAGNNTGFHRGNDGNANRNGNSRGQGGQNNSGGAPQHNGGGGGNSGGGGWGGGGGGGNHGGGAPPAPAPAAAPSGGGAAPSSGGHK